MTIPSYINHTDTKNTGQSTSVTVPSGTNGGDLRLLFFSIQQSTMTSTPSGWTQEALQSQGANSFYVYWRVAAGGVGSATTDGSTTFNFGGGINRAFGWVCTTIRGQAPVPIHGKTQGIDTDGNSTQLLTGPVTTVADCLLVTGCINSQSSVNRSLSSWSPAGSVIRANLSSSFYPNTVTAPKAVAGAVGSTTYTWSSSTDGVLAHIIAVAPSFDTFSVTYNGRL